MVLEAYQNIGESLPLLSQYESFFEKFPEMAQPLMLIYEDLLEFHLRALKYFKQPMWKKLIGSLWKNFQSDFGILLTQLKRHQHLIETQTQLSHFETSWAARESIETILKISEQSQLASQLQFVQGWLAAADTDGDHRKNLEVRVDFGSGEWMLQEHKYLAWADPDFCQNPLFWVNGIPGAGKTVLASVIIQHLKDSFSSLVLFFYCKYGDPTRNTFTSVVKSLLSQILRQNQDLLPYIYDAASRSGEFPLTNRNLAEELLITSMKNCQTVYMVLDGLDECETGERRSIIKSARSSIESLPFTDLGKIRCLFISQDDQAASRDFSGMPYFKIDASHNIRDIQKYTQYWVTEIGEKLGLPSSAQSSLANTVVDNADGMFLYARLINHHLYGQTTLLDLNEEITLLQKASHVPRIDQAYGRIVRHLFDNSAEKRNGHVRRLLGWVVCAKRPMKWQEIQGAISIDLENEEISWDKRKFRENPKELCGSLVEVRDDGSIELVHSTARKYLAQCSLIDLTLEELRFAKLNLDYLCLEGFQTDVSICTDKLTTSKGYYAFFDYSFAHWCQHLELAISRGNQIEGFEDICESIDVFLEAHWNGTREQGKAQGVLKKSLHSLQSKSFYSKLVTALEAAKRQLNVYGRPLDEHQPLDLNDILMTVRAALEKSRENDSKLFQEDIREVYGHNVYKCPRAGCKFFYEGFGTREIRDHHVQKHDRSFFCSFPSCPMAIIGCLTAKELAQHENEKHRTFIMNETEFPDPDLDKEHKTFPCPTCSKTFTRNHSLKTHLRTHNKTTARFKCNFCDKTFGHNKDKIRHESTHATDRKRFVCAGSSAEGVAWGCGKCFSRSEHLQRHMNRKNGQGCREERGLNARSGSEGSIETGEDFSRRTSMSPVT
ncbi:MAG: hypothetical protein M1822_004589 [Bathelium mastoideum]|nr:MAG: hypothetical protein M1822_004589 [Bathelium mastoideum]